jgi:hypothetical protein
MQLIDVVEWHQLVRDSLHYSLIMGRISARTSGKGRVIRFMNSICLMTCNIPLFQGFLQAEDIFFTILLKYSATSCPLTPTRDRIPVPTPPERWRFVFQLLPNRRTSISGLVDLLRIHPAPENVRISEFENVSGAEGG